MFPGTPGAHVMIPTEGYYHYRTRDNQAGNRRAGNEGHFALNDLP